VAPWNALRFLVVASLSCSTQTAQVDAPTSASGCPAETEITATLERADSRRMAGSYGEAREAALNAFDGLPDRVAWENDAIRGQAEEPARPGAFGLPGRAREA
jgi:hypothetical protein